jgi:hypothetical protein
MREKTIDGVRYSLVKSAEQQGLFSLLVRWPDGYVQFFGDQLTEDGWATGAWEALYEDEPMLVTYCAERRDADPRPRPEAASL